MSKIFKVFLVLVGGISAGNTMQSHPNTNLLQNNMQSSTLLQPNFQDKSSYIKNISHTPGQSIVINNYFCLKLPSNSNLDASNSISRQNLADEIYKNYKQMYQNNPNLKINPTIVKIVNKEEDIKSLINGSKENNIFQKSSDEKSMNNKKIFSISKQRKNPAVINEDMQDISVREDLRKFFNTPEEYQAKAGNDSAEMRRCIDRDYQALVSSIMMKKDNIEQLQYMGKWTQEREDCEQMYRFVLKQNGFDSLEYPVLNEYEFRNIMNELHLEYIDARSKNQQTTTIYNRMKTAILAYFRYRYPRYKNTSNNKLQELSGPKKFIKKYFIEYRIGQCK